MRDDRMVRLDELFEQPGSMDEFGSLVRRSPDRDDRPPLATARWWIVHIFAAVSLGTIIYGLLRFMRLGVPYGLVAVTVLAILVLKHVLGEISARAEHPLPDAVTGRGIEPTAPGVVDDRQPEREEAAGLRQSVGPTDGLKYAIGRWEDRLSWSERDPQRFGSLVVPRLRELVDERLRQRYGLTCASDPRRAQQVLGEQVWTLLHGPATRKLDPRDVASVVARLESIKERE
jgi:hypothetical protein